MGVSASISENATEAVEFAPTLVNGKGAAGYILSPGQAPSNAPWLPPPPDNWPGPQPPPAWASATRGQACMDDWTTACENLRQRQYGLHRRDYRRKQRTGEQYVK